MSGARMGIFRTVGPCKDLGPIGAVELRGFRFSRFCSSGLGRSWGLELLKDKP